MKKIFLISAVIFGMLAGNAFAGELAIGSKAPDFTLTDVHGTKHTLSSYKGKFVVLEWTNPDCPFVKKHYDKSGNIPALQKEFTGKGVIWLTIDSAAAGKEGSYPDAELDKIMNGKGFSASALLTDSDGKVGKEYGAKTTPHMFVINPDGVLIYEGGIDDKATPDPDDIKTAHNYVKAALNEAMSGKPVSTSTSRPYGCSVKY